jgi:hypothetical protein
MASKAVAALSRKIFGEVLVPPTTRCACFEIASLILFNFRSPSKYLQNLVRLDAIGKYYPPHHETDVKLPLRLKSANMFYDTLLVYSSDVHFL